MKTFDGKVEIDGHFKPVSVNNYDIFRFFFFENCFGFFNKSIQSNRMFKLNYCCSDVRLIILISQAYYIW